MKLDSRILKGKTYLDCYDTEIAKKFIGKECYLSDGVASFANIDNLNKAMLMEVDDEDMHPYKLENTRWHYGALFILPCEWVKPEEPKKKYRPFSLEEFLAIFSMGNRIDFRKKNDDEVKVAMFTGYITDVERIDDKTPGAVELMLGIFHYSLFSLFEDFELFYNGEWQPFGVEVKEKE